MDCNRYDGPLKFMVDFMLKAMDNLRVVKDEKELKENEHLVAFRLSQDDFHFMKKGKNGSWYDKRGNLKEINRHNEKYVFGKSWYGEYNSDIVLLACKKI